MTGVRLDMPARLNHNNNTHRKLNCLIGLTVRKMLPPRGVRPSDESIHGDENDDDDDDAWVRIRVSLPASLRLDVRAMGASSSCSKPPAGILRVLHKASGPS
jgi:hypothetical protein